MDSKGSRRLRVCSGVLVVAILAVLAPARAIHPGRSFSRPGRLMKLTDRGRLLPYFLIPRFALEAQDKGSAEIRMAARAKLTTLLSDLAEGFPQQPGPVPGRFSLESLPKSVRDAVSARLMRISKDGQVQIYISVTGVTEEVQQQLRDVGVTIELPDKTLGIIQARVPLTRLDGVAGLPFVRSMRLPHYAVHRIGSVTTEGDSILKADQVRSLLNVDGTGVRIGVISDGINGIFATGCTTCPGVTGGPISTMDLPNAIGVRNTSGILTSVSGGMTARSYRMFDNDLEARADQVGCAFSGVGAEGTAILEIVHDLAPGAHLFFANAATDVEFINAVRFLGANTDVAIDDFGFFGLPYDGTSSVSTNTAATLNSSANPIRAYFTSVGNQANVHYLGAYVDSGIGGAPIVGFPGDLHLFQPTADTTDILGLGATTSNVLVLPADGTVVIVLVWNDPFGASTNDYNMFLVQESTNAVVAKSTNPQTGTQDPDETIFYRNTTGAQDRFHIYIQNAGNKAAPRVFSLFAFQPGCAALGPTTLPGATNHEKLNYNTAKSSLSAESDAGGSPASVISVGAIRASDPGNVNIEFFSSHGPTLDGRLKPDVTAIDGVSVTGAGNFANPFYGTSAAAPHGAGVAALLLHAAPCLLSGSSGAILASDARVTLRSLILNNALDLGDPGPDNIFGYGRIDALAAANHTLPTASVGSSQTVSASVSGGGSVTLDGSSSTDPLGCPLTFNWSGSCGSASGMKPTVTCPPGTGTESLQVTANGVTLSSAVSVQVTVTDFALSASPSSATVNAGQSATYKVTVDPQFGPFTNSVTLGCSNLPAAASCSFSPATFTPGSNPATSQLVVTTIARSASPKWPSEPSRPPFLLPYLIGLMGLAMLAIQRTWKRPRARALSFCFSIALLVILLLIQGACGGGGSQPPPTSGTPAGSYTISITGTTGTLVHSTGTTLVVN